VANDRLAVDKADVARSLATHRDKGEVALMLNFGERPAIDSLRHPPFKGLRDDLAGPFTDALFDVTHQAYLVAYSKLAGIFATEIEGCANGLLHTKRSCVTSCRNCFPARSFALVPVIFV